ncbi:cell wall hydrolase [Cohnella herbarum]|uniref:LysM peptidoglycan-binding domain-containing protein n=1 Tax=Cohnella herbarum TaxID=2728023 RepID=A0A7Z2VKJ1_9BACL|nr:cell wall hydrolase [Cohnella herbarum]QJD84948.1 LysM peptidoglycan-binding domain-containing protein [Cohnella herbarum]
MLHRSKQVRGRLLIPLFTLLLLCMSLPVAAAAEENTETAAHDVTIKINGIKAKLADTVRMRDDRLFLPIANLAVALNARSEWDNDNEAVTIHTVNKDKIVLSNGVPVVYFNDNRYRMDVAPFVAGGRIYIPLRHVAELLHATVKWDPEAQLVELDAVKPAVVTESYGLTEIGKEFGVSKSTLVKRNGLKSADEIKAGDSLKIIIPSVLQNEAEPYTEKDYMLLAKLTQVESGYETYEGQLAVANVVLNRVKDSRFPNTIRDVIYSGKQFPVAHNGLLDKSVPNASVLRAAKDALNGKNNVKDAVYFYDPSVSSGPFWSGLDTIATFGTHRFAK